MIPDLKSGDEKMYKVRNWWTEMPNGHSISLQLWSIYFLLVAMSRSSKELALLHESLPGNCQLPREQLIFLNKVWQRIENQDDRRSALLDMIKIMLPPDFHDRCWPLYRLLLRQGRKCGYSPVHYPEIDSAPGKRFIITFKGWEQGLMLCCKYEFGGALFPVIIVPWQDLTEKLVHFLRSLPESYYHHDRLLTEEHFVFYVAPHSETSWLENQDLSFVSPSGDNLRLAGAKFMATLAKALEELGLPVLEIRPQP